MKHFYTFLFFLTLSNLSFCQTIDWTTKANPSNLTINSVAFTTSGDKVMAGTNCHPAYIKIYESGNGTQTWEHLISSGFNCIMNVAFSNNTDYIAAMEEFGNVFIFDNTGSQPVLIDTLDTGTTQGFSSVFSPDNSKLVLGCSNGKVQIYDVATGSLDTNIAGHPSFVKTVDYASNGQFFVTGGGAGGQIKKWSPEGNLLLTITAHTGDINNVEITPDNNYVISGSNDKKVKIWDINTGTLIHTISDHTDRIWDLDISPDGSKFVSVSKDSTCRIWNFNTWEQIANFGVSDSGFVRSVAWSPLGNKIATGNAVSDLTMWDISELSLNENLSSINFDIYPNPSTEVLFLSTSIVDSEYFISISNELGQEIIRLPANSQKIEIPLDNISNGVYTIKIESNSTSISKRFIVQK
ncbi:MAG: T9SS type A sorting domain-containing protein [Fluviicola sp.]